MDATTQLKTIYPHVAELLEKHSRNASKTLEVGCGDAKYRRYVEGHYVGIDLPTNRAGSSGPSIFGDAQNLPLKSNYFDFVFLVAVLHVIPDAISALRESFRILRPGGKLLVIDYNYFGTRRLAQMNQKAIGRATHVWSPWGLVALLRRARFSPRIEWDYSRGSSPILIFLQRFKLMRYFRFWIYQLKGDWSVLSATKPE